MDASKARDAPHSPASKRSHRSDNPARCRLLYARRGNSGGRVASARPPRHIPSRSRVQHRSQHRALHRVRCNFSRIFRNRPRSRTRSHHDHENIGWIPKEILERPVTLRKDIGNLHEPVTTASPQAQAFYDQGLNYLHDFDWIEAARAFNQSLRLDPNLAMAYLGLSDVSTELQDNAAARAAFEKAQSLAGAASERERTRIQIRAAQLDFPRGRQFRHAEVFRLAKID